MNYFDTFTVLHPFGSIWIIDRESQLFLAPSISGKPWIYTLQDMAILIGEICGNDDKPLDVRGIIFFRQTHVDGGLAESYDCLSHKIHHFSPPGS